MTRRGEPKRPAVAVASAVFTLVWLVGCGDDLTPGASGMPVDGPTPPAMPAPPATGPLCASGQICTVAGTGVAGDGQDGLPARQTRLYLPQDVTLGPDGRLYVVDWNNHRIRAIGPDGIMKVVAGIGELGATPDDPSTERLNHPTNVAFDPMGLADQMLIAAWHNSRIKRVDLVSGAVVDICGDGRRGFAGNGGPAVTATLDLPVAIAFDGSGNLLIADQANQMIRRVDRATDVITTIAGTGRCADEVNPNPCVLNDGAPALEAGFHFPIGQAASPGGRIEVAADGSIYVADTENFRLRRVDPTGVVTTVAGNGRWGFAGDGGPATEAQLGRLTDVAVAKDGRIFIADTDNHCVRVLGPDGIIATFAGRCGQRGFGGDDGPAGAALLDRPFGVALGREGELYVADTHNHRVRVVYP